MTIAQCGNCRFAHRDDPDIDACDAAECRAHPPTYKSSGSQWPMVFLTDWCGEFVAEPDAPPKPTRHVKLGRKCSIATLHAERVAIGLVRPFVSPCEGCGATLKTFDDLCPMRDQFVVTKKPPPHDLYVTPRNPPTLDQCRSH